MSIIRHFIIYPLHRVSLKREIVWYNNNRENDVQRVRDLSRRPYYIYSIVIILQGDDDKVLKSFSFFFMNIIFTKNIDTVFASYPVDFSTYQRNMIKDTR